MPPPPPQCLERLGLFTYHTRLCACWRRRGTSPAWARSPASPDARSSSRGHGSTWEGRRGLSGGLAAGAQRAGSPHVAFGLSSSTPQAGPAPAPTLTSLSRPQASGSRRGRSSSRSRCTAAPTSLSPSRSSPRTGPGSRQPGPLQGGRAAAIRFPRAPRGPLRS